MKEELQKLPWSDVTTVKKIVTRQACWLVEGACTCSYKYGRQFKFTSQAHFRHNKAPDFICRLARQIETELGLPEHWLNACNGNAYLCPNHELFLHKDDEKMFREAESPTSKRDVLICSLSYGAERNFIILQDFKDKDTQQIQIPSKDGDLITMERRFQDNYKHGIEKANTSIASADSAFPNTVRYNLTFRRIQKHAKGCPCHATF